MFENAQRNMLRLEYGMDEDYLPAMVSEGIGCLWMPFVEGMHYDIMMPQSASKQLLSAK